MKRGVLAAGNWITDEVKMLDIYPKEENLANILAEYTSNGGCAYNVLKDLSMLGAPFPLEGIGLIGKDQRGAAILEDCRSHEINTRQLRQLADINTSYTQVMTVKTTGKRTFFHQRGANTMLNEEDFDFTSSSCRLFHLGYLLLLDKLDVVGTNGYTGAATVLKRAKGYGLTTSVDIVSENSDRFKDVIPPSLPFVDYLFINEYEAAKLSDVKTTCERGSIDVKECIKAASQIIKMGVKEYVILHFPEGVIAVSGRGEILIQPGIDLPAEKVVGMVGAGDALAAGVLMGIHEGWKMKKSLELGVCAAASSLFSPTPSDSVLPFRECSCFSKQYGFRRGVSSMNKIPAIALFNI